MADSRTSFHATPILVFDIETVPDVRMGRLLYGFDDTLTDHAITEAMLALQRQSTGSDFLPHDLQQIVAISVVFKQADLFQIFSLGHAQSSASTESGLIAHFFQGIEKHKPRLVSWNGSGFDLPVLHYRSLYHGIRAPQYWDQGEGDGCFKWNNYINRYHDRHTDLMDRLSKYQPRASVPLDRFAQSLGLPGKWGLSGKDVWRYYHKGQIQVINQYCEIDVLNTYLVYLRFALFQGQLTHSNHQSELERVKTYLSAADASREHLHAFHLSWLQTEVSQCF